MSAAVAHGPVAAVDDGRLSLDPIDCPAHPDRHSDDLKYADYRFDAFVEGVLKWSLVVTAPCPCGYGRLKECLVEEMSADPASIEWLPCQVQYFMVGGRVVEDSDTFLDNSTFVEAHLTKFHYQDEFDMWVNSDEVPEQDRRAYRSIVCKISNLECDRTRDETVAGSYHMKRLLDFIIGAHRCQVKSKYSQDLRHKIVELVKRAGAEPGATRASAVRSLDWQVERDRFLASIQNSIERDDYESIIRLFQALPQRTLPIRNSDETNEMFTMLFMIHLLETIYLNKDQVNRGGGGNTYKRSSDLDDIETYCRDPHASRESVMDESAPPPN